MATSRIVEKGKLNMLPSQFTASMKLRFNFKFLCLLSLSFVFFSCKQPDASEALAKVEALFEQNDWENAAYELKKMLPLGEDHPRIYALYAYVQNRRGLGQEVEKFILKAHPTNAEIDPQVMTMIGRIYLERGEYPEAIKALDLAYRNDLDNPTPLRLLMLAEISHCKKADDSYDINKYIKSAKGLKYLMGRKQLRDQVFYNHLAIKEITKDGNRNFIMPFLQKADSLAPGNPSTTLNAAIALDIIYKSPKLARIRYAKFLEMTKGSKDPQIPEVERRLRQLQGLQ
jgi:tetratricopeptide (TPR) repeat protein